MPPVFCADEGGPDLAAGGVERVRFGALVKSVGIRYETRRGRRAADARQQGEKALQVDPHALDQVSGSQVDPHALDQVPGSLADVLRPSSRAWGSARKPGAAAVRAHASLGLRRRFSACFLDW